MLFPHRDLRKVSAQPAKPADTLEGPSPEGIAAAEASPPRFADRAQKKGCRKDFSTTCKCKAERGVVPPHGTPPRADRLRNHPETLPRSLCRVNRLLSLSAAPFRPQPIPVTARWALIQGCAERCSLPAAGAAPLTNTYRTRQRTATCSSPDKAR